MPSLTLIRTEAARLLRRIPTERRAALQTALVRLCEEHWQRLRGAQPQTPLAQALWSVTPPLADLFIDLYGAGESGLFELLPELTLSQGLALLVLAEIERGNEAAVHITHEPMMAFESAHPHPAWRQRHSELLRGTLSPPLQHPHARHPAMWRALAAIAAHTGRLDLPAIHEVILRLTAEGAPRDEQLEALRHEVQQQGICFLTIEDDHLEFEQHGHAHKPLRMRQLGEMLLEIRQQWLQ